MAATAQPAWVDDVLVFWFGAVGPDGWFRKNDALDATLRERFLSVYEALAPARVEDALASPDRALATIVVLDQFPRNMFRGTGRAFAADAAARKIARAMVDAGLDREISAERRLFVYLPFEHSEDIGDQEQSVALIGSLGDANLTHWAERHKAVIDRFGRFPHRNAVLGRLSTAEEIAFLAESGSTF